MKLSNSIKSIKKFFTSSRRRKKKKNEKEKEREKDKNESVKSVKAKLYFVLCYLP